MGVVLMLSCLAVMFVALKGSKAHIAGFEKTPLQALLNKFSIPCDSLDQMVEDTQRMFLRAQGKERWEVEQRCEQDRPELLKLFKQLGLVQTWEPTRTSYTYVLLLGGTAISMRDRLRYLIELLERGIQAQQIVLLVGQRDVDVEKDIQPLQDLGINTNDIHTETDVIQSLYAFFQKQHVCLAAHSPIIIDTPKQVDSGVVRRPNTADTIRTWLCSEEPHAGTCLVISSQPFCHYQHVTCTTLLPNEFIIETVGKTDNEKSSIAVYLDTVARALYQYKNGKQVLVPNTKPYNRVPPKFKY